MTITFADIERELRLVVAEMPDFVYVDFRRKQLIASGTSEATIDSFNDMNCVYIDEDGEPGCIFGQVLHRLGFTNEEITQYEGDGIRAVLQALEVNLSEDQFSYLDNIQSNQDNKTLRYSWKDAVDEADEEHYPGAK